MLNKMIKNLITPKPEMKVGQVWGTITSEFKMVITAILDETTVRAVVIGEDNFGDKYDVLLKTKDYPNILTRDQMTMRVTDSPLLREDLTQYLYSLTDKDTAKLLKSLETERSNYNEIQELVNAKYLRKLDPLVIRCLRKSL